MIGFMRIPGRGKANLGMLEKANFPEEKGAHNCLGAKAGTELARWPSGGLAGMRPRGTAGLTQLSRALPIPPPARR